MYLQNKQSLGRIITWSARLYIRSAEKTFLHATYLTGEHILILDGNLNSCFAYLLKNQQCSLKVGGAEADA